MKTKRRLYFPILLKVILLGIIVGATASGVSIAVSYANMISKAKDDLDVAATESLEYANGVFSGNTQEVSQKITSFQYIKNYVYTRYSSYEEVRQAEVKNYPSFSDYEQVFINYFGWYYPHGMIGSPEYLAFLPEFTNISDTLTVVSLYSEQTAYYAIVDPDDDSKLIYLLDSRHSKLKESGKYYHTPGSHYDLSTKDKVSNTKVEYVKKYTLNGKQTKYIDIQVINNVTGEYETIGYLFVDLDFSRVYAEYQPILRNEIIILLISGLAVILLYAALSYFMFIKSINKLNKAAIDISNQLKKEKNIKPHDIKVRSHDEMKNLSESFNVMEHQLVDYVEIIKADAKEKEKINAELDIASRIQLEALPLAKFDDSNASIRAYIKPAKEVGGDFYDYFYLDENRLAIIISDVSGKGIPAALFMMRSKALIKTAIHTHDNLVDAISWVNSELYRNNKESLFVTSFVGVIDFKKNTISYVNAGHEKPYIVSKDKIIKLEGESNFIIGGVDEFKYKEEKHAFNKGDYIFLFTDGLNESINNNKEEFSYSRVEKTLDNTRGEPLEEIIKVMNEKLDEFVGKEEQFDDVTMLVVKTQQGELDLSYDKKDYSIITDVVDKFEQNFAYLPSSTKASVGIIIDELLNNQISYEKREDLKIDAHFKLAKDGLEIKVSSNGEDYNPFTNHKEKYYDEYHPELKEGGFGLSIIKDLAKSHKYEYKKNKGPTITLVVETKEKDGE